MPERTTELLAAAYRVLTNRTFRDFAGNPADPESSALQALLDAVSAAEKTAPRYVVHCERCTSAPHGGLKHGAGKSLGALNAPCTAPGCGCPGYAPVFRPPGKP